MHPTRNDQKDDGLGPWNDRGPAKRPWFGPKPFGIGYRPQTWQGFLVAAAIAATAIVITQFAHGRAAAFLPLLLVLVIPLIRMMSRRRR